MGLGNPGPEYENTRHNAGFLLADRLAARWRLPAFRRVPAARETQGNVEGTDVRLIKPQTYMNRSGAALASLRSLSGLRSRQGTADRGGRRGPPDRPLPPSSRRFRRRSQRPQEHRGRPPLPGIPRLRIGVGPVPPEQEGLADYVLDQFSKEERSALNELLDPMSEAVECWVLEGIEPAMNRFNSPKP